MARFTLIGMATTEFVTHADTATDALKAWEAHQQRHPIARQGRMTIRLLRDKPTVLDTDGHGCTVQPRRRKTTFNEPAG